MTWTGPAPLTADSAATAWQFDVPALAVCVLLAAAYLAGVRRVSGGWPAGRTVRFLAGVVVLAATTCSFLGVYARTLFWVFSLQVCLLLLVAPMLLAAGAPVALAGAALPPGARRGFDRAGRSLVARVLRKPGIGPFLLVVVTLVVFLTPALVTVLRDPAAFQLLHLVLLVVGVVMALPIADEGVTLSSTAYAAMLGLGFFEFLADAIPGITVRLHSRLIGAGYWAAQGRPWGPSLLDDQHLAGSLLWFFGEAGDLPFLVLIMVAWIRADKREAAQIDRELDTAALAGAQTAPASTSAESADSGAPVAAEPPLKNRPWWETDSSVFGDERARRNGWKS